VASEPPLNTFAYVNPAADFDARIKLNKRSDTNLAIDFGFASGSFNIDVGLGEWF